MAKYLYYICACCLLFLFSGCEGKSKGEAEDLPFSPYVEALPPVRFRDIRPYI